MGLNHTTLHPTTPPGTFRPLLDKLGKWNLFQTLIRPTRFRNSTHFHTNRQLLTLSPGGKLKTSRFQSKVLPRWTLLTWVLFQDILGQYWAPTADYRVMNYIRQWNNETIYMCLKSLFLFKNQQQLTNNILKCNSIFFCQQLISFCI